MCFGALKTQALYRLPWSFHRETSHTTKKSSVKHRRNYIVSGFYSFYSHFGEFHETIGVWDQIGPYLTENSPEIQSISNNAVFARHMTWPTAPASEIVRGRPHFPHEGGITYYAFFFFHFYVLSPYVIPPSCGKWGLPRTISVFNLLFLRRFYGYVRGNYFIYFPIFCYIIQASSCCSMILLFLRWSTQNFRKYC